MLYFPKLIFWITDFTDVGFHWCWRGCVWGLGSLQLGFWIRIYRIYRIKKNVFGLTVKYIRRGLLSRLSHHVSVFQVETRCLASSPKQDLNLKFTPNASFWIRIYRILRITEDVLVFKEKVIHKGLRYILLFADALRIGKWLGNESTV